MKFNTSALNGYCVSLLTTLLPLSSAPLHASDDELFFDMPIVLSSNRLEQSVSDAAVSISVIDRETIVASGARNIPEILRLVPGMQVGYSGNEFGSEPKYVVAYHGHSDEYSKQMQVLIDGRSIYEPFFGGINWNSIPVNINDIERIEVSRGPNMATYGSNSFQAAINIITRTASEDQGAFIQSNLGNNDIADLTYRYGGNNGNLDYRATISTYNDAGLDSANEYDYADDTHSNNIDYRLDYQVNNKNTLSYQGGYGENRQQADQIYGGLLPLARTVENKRFFQFIKWENAIDQENTLLLQYYYNLSDKKDESMSASIDLGAPFDPFTLDANFNIKSERHNLELTHFIYPDENLKVVWGISAQTDHVRAPLYLGGDEKLTSKQFRGFANIEWHINHSNIINVGGLVEKNDFTDTELSPRLAYTHALSENHKIRFGISQAIRSPFINEAQGDLSYSHDLTVGGADAGLTVLDQQILGGIPGNANLDNEKITSREIAYFGTFLDAALLFNARLFHDNISDFIDSKREDVTALNPDDNVPDNLSELSNPTASNTVLVFQNPIQSTTNGLELELDYHFDTTLRLIASGAIINVSSNSMSIFLSAPQHSYSLLAIKQFNERYNGSIAYYHVDAFKWTDARGVTDDFSTDSYRTLDMRASRSFKFNRTRGSLSLVLKNLLDEYSDYQENPSHSAAPRVVHSTLAYLDFRLNF